MNLAAAPTTLTRLGDMTDPFGLWLFHVSPRARIALRTSNEAEDTLAELRAAVACAKRLCQCKPAVCLIGYEPAQGSLAQPRTHPL